MRLIRLALAALAAALFVFIALANRHGVVVSIDPIDGILGAANATIPLYLLLFAAAFIGIAFGAGLTWLGQSHHRKAARAAKQEKKRLSRLLMDGDA